MRAWIVAWVCLAACGDEAPSPASESESDQSAEAAREDWVAVRRPSKDSAFEFSARVVASPEAFAEVGAPARARVVGVRVRPGQRVAQGDALVEVVMPEVFDAAAGYVGASDRLRVHRTRQSELEALLEQNLVDRSRVFEQRAIVSELEAERARSLAVLRAAGISASAARAVLSEGKIALRAPIAGTVTALDARLGETREPSSPPFARLASEGAATIEVRSPEALPSTAQVTFETQDGRRVELRAPPSSTAVDPVDGTHLTWFSVDAATLLPHGLRGRARVSFEDAWELPTTAIRQENARAVALRRTTSSPEEVEVHVLTLLGDRVLVHGPFRNGDVVASRPEVIAPSAPQ